MLALSPNIMASTVAEDNRVLRSPFAVCGSYTGVRRRLSNVFLVRGSYSAVLTVVCRTYFSFAVRLRGSHCRGYTSHFALRTLHYALRTSHFAFRSSLFAVRTLHFAVRSSHFAVQTVGSSYHVGGVGAWLGENTSHVTESGWTR